MNASEIIARDTEHGKVLHDLANQQMAFGMAERAVAAKRGAIEAAEARHSQLAAIVKEFAKVTKALAAMPEMEFARLRTAGSRDPHLHTPTVPGPVFRAMAESMAESADRQLAAAAQELERVRTSGDLARAEADLAKIGQRIEELKELAATT